MPPQSSPLKAPPSAAFPWSYSYLRLRIRKQLLWERQVLHKPREDYPFTPSTKPAATFTLPRHAATRLFQMKLAASYLLGRPNLHRPEPGLCPRCEEEIEHALSIPLPRTSIRPGVLPRDPGPQVRLVWRHFD